jgi:hypothetical protein
VRPVRIAAYAPLMNISVWEAVAIYSIVGLVLAAVGGLAWMLVHRRSEHRA